MHDTIATTRRTSVLDIGLRYVIVSPGPVQKAQRDATHVVSATLSESHIPEACFTPHGADLVFPTTLARRRLRSSI